MEEELIFSYPDDDKIVTEQFEKLIQIRSKRKKLALFGLIFSCGILLISSATHIKFLDYVAYAGFIFSAVMLYAMRFGLSNRLMIKAYNNRMHLVFYNGIGGEKQEISLDYDDIVKGVFLNKYTSVMLVYRESKNSYVKYYNENGKEIQKNQSEIIRFPINQNTPEQGFFLYTAPKLFNMEFDKKKMLGKFSDEEDYYNGIYDMKND